MSDWRTYDSIADAYERRCRARFEEAARRLLAFAGTEEAGRVLDLGTGTGAVLSALGGRCGAMALVAGCDRSVPMLRIARVRIAGMRALAADVTCLPLRSASFDLVTANCVLSHLRTHREALGEVRRVLVRGGVVAVSSWGPASDPYSAAWNSLLTEAVGDDAARRALEEVVPLEAFLAEPENLRRALVGEGFRGVTVAVTELGNGGPIEDYVAERAMTAGARYGRHALGESDWGRFVERAKGDLRRRFGAHVRYVRPLVLARGTAP